MALDARTAQEQLTPDERRAMLRAFADRMLLKAAAMDDPEDMPGVERAVRVAAAIERVYSRCDRAEARAPDPHKLAAERARSEIEAIQARNNLEETVAWSKKRTQDRDWDPKHWYRASPQAAKPAPSRPPGFSGEGGPSATTVGGVSDEAAPEFTPPPPSPPRGEDKLPPVRYVDYTDAIEAARAALGLSPSPLFEADEWFDGPVTGPAHHPPDGPPSP